VKDSKEHIIEVSCKLFLQKSYKEVTMNELVKKSGLSKGAFYHYFKSKEDLFLAVLEFFFTTVHNFHFHEYSKDSLYEFYHDYSKNVEILTEKFVPMLKDNESDDEFTMNYFTLAFDALKLFPDFKSKMIESQTIERRMWMDAIELAKNRGEIKTDIPDEKLAKMFIYMGDGSAMHLVMNGSYLTLMVKPIIELWDQLYELIKA
jgi:TetR/AcrR family transcriptional regulator, transcriptional repressor for nem operon